MCLGLISCQVSIWKSILIDISPKIQYPIKFAVLFVIVTFILFISIHPGESCLCENLISIYISSKLWAHWKAGDIIW